MLYGYQYRFVSLVGLWTKSLTELQDLFLQCHNEVSRLRQNLALAHTAGVKAGHKLVQISKSIFN